MKKVGNIVCSMVKNIRADSISYELTDEQKQCVETARQGKDLKIKAFAGSGKTSVAEALRPKGSMQTTSSGIIWEHIFHALPLYELASAKKT